MTCSCGETLAPGTGRCPQCGAAAVLPKKRKLSAGILFVLLVAASGCVVFGGIVAAIAVPNFLNAVDRGKSKRTMMDLRTLGIATETYAIDHDHYPLSSDLDEFLQAISPYREGTAPLPARDGWGNPFGVQAYGSGYAIGSGGKDGAGPFDIPPGGGGPTSSFDAAIVFSDGQLIQWPEGMGP